MMSYVIKIYSMRGLLGHTGFLEARVEDGGVRTSLGRLAIPLSLPEGSPLELLVRPDDLALGGPGPANARVERRIFLGMQQLYRLRMDDGSVLKALAPAEQLVHEGESLRADLRPGRHWVVFHEGKAVG